MKIYHRKDPNQILIDFCQKYNINYNSLSEIQKKQYILKIMDAQDKKISNSRKFDLKMTIALFIALVIGVIIYCIIK